MDFRILSGVRPGSRPDRPAATVPQGPAEVRAYWEGLRQGGAIPARSAIDPRGLAQSLDRIFIAQRIGPGLAQVRIAGAALGECMGTDLRGLPLSCLFLPEDRPRLATLLEKLFTATIAADLRLEAERGIGRPELSGRLVLLPLLDAADQPSLVLGCLGLGGRINRAPRRFGIVSAVEEQLLAQGTPTPQAPVAAQADRPRSHLRLVHSA